MAQVPNITLNDGKTIPQLGFGVWEIPNSSVAKTVVTAIEAGYRSIDTAQGYGNEEGVGQGIVDSGLPREELFITSKLRTKDQGYDATLKSFMGSLDRLGLDYLDLFLIHWPVPKHDRYSDTWKAFVQLQRDGRIRSIGVSNFLQDHLERIIGDSGVVPAVNQIELHPEFQQRDVRAFHSQHNIAIECYSPLGRGQVLGNDIIGRIAARHGTSPAQVIIRWHVQQGLIAIPKSVRPERIKANIDVFGFALDEDDMAAIATLDKSDGKMVGDPATNNSLW
ncbi:MAG: aldo/keto reductase [Alphaproteobacteria bacterium]|jgi:2,5-diketo-D-gluconate reductase A|nr:aldo/keto reductase [Alphaproteobacteria bacterium]MBU1561692.1 aldo/keto reductase [Alphaproteobacteria bacterium]MBU2301280.1 aldo/keto reductase [Alphaproteobacteria bacterium]MBU2367103.1 aldo/keto reductase [Alphaproteobacteria bacterium]